MLKSGRDLRAGGRIGHFAFFVMMGWGAVPWAAAATLQVLSPQDGTEFVSGSAVIVQLRIPSQMKQTSLRLNGTDLEKQEEVVDEPSSFLIHLPDDRIGPQTLDACATTASGQTVCSKAAAIDIEPGRRPQNLHAKFSTLYFRYPGEKLSDDIVGTLNPRKPPVNLRLSSEIMFQTSNPHVAIVSRDGIITAVGAGTAEIMAVYLGQSIPIRVSVPLLKRGDLSVFPGITNRDLNVILLPLEEADPAFKERCQGQNHKPFDCASFLPKSLRVPATQPVDARDMNGDGWIDYQDIKELIELCSKPRCAH